MNNQQPIMGSPKNVALAVILGIFLGPIGMLYSTVPGALIMLVINIIVGILTVGLGLLVTQPICAIWAGVAANNYNQKLAGLNT